MITSNVGIFRNVDDGDSQTRLGSHCCLSRRRLYLACFVVLVGCIFVTLWNAKSFRHGLTQPVAMNIQKSPYLQQESAVEQSTAVPVPLVQPELCVDPDEPHDNNKCRCTDPKIPIPGNHIQQWMLYHEQLVQEATTTTIADNLDLVMLGDSLIELWHGTTMMGSRSSPQQQRLFDSLFTRAGGGTLDALALGTAADKAPNLLWHLQNGMLPERLNPKVWLLLIGTNDLGFAHCSKQTTLTAILHVAEHLHEQRPNGTILLHGLLPRGGEGGRRPQQRSVVLGETWHRIRWINQQLKQACNDHNRRSTSKDWYYMDAGQLFLNADRTQLNPRTVADGIHPRLSGMRQWGPLIVQNVQRILSDKNE